MGSACCIGIGRRKQVCAGSRKAEPLGQQKKQRYPQEGHCEIRKGKKAGLAGGKKAAASTGCFAKERIFIFRASLLRQTAGVLFKMGSRFALVGRRHDGGS